MTDLEDAGVGKMWYKAVQNRQECSQICWQFYILNSNGEDSCAANRSRSETPMCAHMDVRLGNRGTSHGTVVFAMVLNSRAKAKVKVKEFPV